MPKSPLQPPIVLKKQGTGEFAMVADLLVPIPPEGCESQQMMDWGSVIAVLTASHLILPAKIRMVEAYAERYKIPTDG